jgi:thiol-disulfide isomerase/thioredoxin
LAATALAAGALVAILVVGLQHQDEAASAPTGSAPILTPQDGDGKPAPALTGRDLAGGGRISLAALSGRPVVVNFFASWCAPCKVEGPELRAFAAAHPEVAMLSVDAQDNDGPGLAFARAEGWRWPVLGDESGDHARAWRVGGLPATFVVDAAGRLRKIKLGQTTRAELERLIGELA